MFAIIMNAAPDDLVIVMSGPPVAGHVKIRAYSTVENAIEALLPPLDYSSDVFGELTVIQMEEFFNDSKPFIIEVDVADKTLLEKYVVREKNGISGCHFGVKDFCELDGMRVNEDIRELKVSDVFEQFTKRKLAGKPIASN